MPDCTPATAADLASIRQLHTESWRSAYAPHLPAQALETVEAEMAARWAELPEGVICAREGDAIVGFVRLMDKKGWPYIDNLHVAPDLKRGGVGRALMCAAASDLQARGDGRVWLTVLGGNTGARRFYQAMGGVEGAAMTEVLLGAEVTTYPLIWNRLAPIFEAAKKRSSPLDAPAPRA